MPRPSTARSALALFCISLRTSRKLTQQDIAESAGIHVSSVKAAEGDRDLSVKKLGQLYRSLKGKAALSDSEWHLLMAYWLQREFPAGVRVEALASAVKQAEAGKASGLDARTAKMKGALDALTQGDAELIISLAKRAGAKGSPVLPALRALAAM